MEVTNKVALVFGGNGGMGRCTVIELLKNGVKGVVIADCNNEGIGEYIRKEVEPVYKEGSIEFLKVDVAHVEDVKNAFEVCIQKYNAIDFVINFAAIVDENDYERTITVNLIGALHVTHEAYKYLPKHKSSTTEQAVIVNLASVTGLAPHVVIPMYSIAKVGLVALGHCLSVQKEWGDDRAVKLLTLCPGLTETRMAQQGRSAIEAATGKLKQKLTEIFVDAYVQKPESVAACILHIIRCGSNGSFWLSKNDEIAKPIDYDAILAAGYSTFAD